MLNEVHLGVYYVQHLLRKLEEGIETVIESGVRG